MILPCMHISAADPGKEPIIQFHTNLYDKKLLHSMKDFLAMTNLLGKATAL